MYVAERLAESQQRLQILRRTNKKGKPLLAMLPEHRDHQHTRYSGHACYPDGCEYILEALYGETHVIHGAESVSYT